MNNRKRNIGCYTLVLIIIFLLCLPCLSDVLQSRYDAIYDEGYSAGYDRGYDEGYRAGYDRGYDLAEGLYSSIRDIHSGFSDSDSSSYESDEWVYVTDSGTKYHRLGCSYLKSSNQISYSDAISLGYEPCSRCY